jgi:hypothetical protein
MAAFRTLGRLAGPSHLPALVELLVALKAEGARAEAERAVASVTRQIADEARRADSVLAALRSSRDTPTQCSLLRVLGRIANAPAYEALLAAARAENAMVKDAAVRALAGWPDPRALGPLLEILKGSANDTHRILALRGCVRLLKQRSAQPAEVAQAYAQTMACARRAEEKRLILSGLADVHHPEALRIAAGSLADEKVRTEAALAAIAIARHLAADETEGVNAAMKQIVATVQEEDLRSQAANLIRRPRPPLPDVYLDTLTPVTAVSGNDGGRGKPQINKNCVGAPLRLKGAPYERGVGEHAKADLTYALKPDYKRFVCVVGLDDQVGRHGDVRGSIVVKVFVDDKLMVGTPVLRGAGAASNVDIEIPRGAKTLRLLVDDAGDGVDYDDADFVNAGFLVGDSARPR